MPTVTPNIDDAVAASVLSNGRIVLWERRDLPRELAEIDVSVERLLHGAGNNGLTGDLPSGHGERRV